MVSFVDVYKKKKERRKKKRETGSPKPEFFYDKAWRYLHKIKQLQPRAGGRGVMRYLKERAREIAEELQRHPMLAEYANEHAIYELLRRLNYALRVNWRWLYYYEQKFYELLQELEKGRTDLEQDIEEIARKIVNKAEEIIALHKLMYEDIGLYSYLEAISMLLKRQAELQKLRADEVANIVKRVLQYSKITDRNYAVLAVQALMGAIETIRIDIIFERVVDIISDNEVKYTDRITVAQIRRDAPNEVKMNAIIDAKNIKTWDDVIKFIKKYDRWVEITPGYWEAQKWLGSESYYEKIAMHKLD